MSTPPQDLPPSSYAAFEALTPEQQARFAGHYNTRRRSMALMVALSILFPIQLFLLDRVILGILFLITGGGFGVWYVIEWFLTPGRVRDYNAKVASDALAIAGAGDSVAQEEE